MTTYHTVEATTQRKAEKAHDTLIRELERKGSAHISKLTLGEFLDEFVRFKEAQVQGGGKLVERTPPPWPFCAIIPTFPTFLEAR